MEQRSRRSIATRKGSNQGILKARKQKTQPTVVSRRVILAVSRTEMIGGTHRVTHALKDQCSLSVRVRVRVRDQDHHCLQTGQGA